MASELTSNKIRELPHLSVFEESEKRNASTGFKWTNLIEKMSVCVCVLLQKHSYMTDSVMIMIIMNSFAFEIKILSWLKSSFEISHIVPTPRSCSYLVNRDYDELSHSTSSERNCYFMTFVSNKNDRLTEVAYFHCYQNINFLYQVKGGRGGKSIDAIRSITLLNDY